jgi:hypothetical protein
MANAVEAMGEVMGYLNEGNVAGAQAAVCAIEADSCTLPSCIFERVLRASVEAGCLLPFYAEFCERSYGRKAYAAMLASMTSKVA